MTDLLKKINEHIALGNIRSQTDGELTIYNYTEQCTYSKAWDDVTRMCRGLILDNEGNIVARPYKKFFNIDEMPEVYLEELMKKDHKNVTYADKLDGSLGIIFKHKGEIRMATRGSFTSDQAIEGMKILKEKYLEEMERVFTDNVGITICCEIIYPENQVVVKYGFRDIIITGIIINDTGEELNYTLCDLYCREWSPGLRFVDSYTGTLVDVLHQIDQNTPNTEGFVLMFSDGTRVKVKTEEYVRLHRIVTNMSPKAIWEGLSQDVDWYNNIAPTIPEEFRQWVEGQVKGLLEDFITMHLVTERFIKTELKDATTRKQIAEIVTNSDFPYKSLVFSMLDNKDVSREIWKRIKPKGTTGE